MKEVAPDLVNIAEDRDENVTLVMETLDNFIEVAREAKKIADRTPNKDTTKVEVKRVTADEADAILRNWLKAFDF